MSSRRRPTAEDAHTAIQLLLTAVASGIDLDDIMAEMASLHPRHNTFPGEVFIGLAADALEEAGFSRSDPFPHEQIRERFLPEYDFRGREHQKIRYAVLCAAAPNSYGVEADLLDEVAYWGSDDFWQYAMFAALAYVRAGAQYQNTDVGTFCRRLARRHGLDTR